jgi:very-short-patch-repair endonuclease
MLAKSIFSDILTSSELRLMQHVGVHRMIKPRLNFTSLERKYYSMLKDLNVFYVAQYPMGGRYYDAYLPDQNILLEFDGSFWHKEKEEDCKYDFQRKNMATDKLKDKMAKEKGIKIIRIREDKPITQAQLKKLIWD